ncbi:hypothetical protein [Nocardia sp. NPDC004711]
MKAVKVRGNDELRVEALVLPLPHLSGPFDADLYRRRARGELPLVVRDYVPVTYLRSIVLSGGAIAAPVADHLSGLVFVATGCLRMPTPSGDTEILPGDIGLLDIGPGGAAQITAEPDTRLVQFDLDGPVERAGEWATADAVATLPDRNGPNFKQMRKGVGDAAYFHDFDDLFPAEPDVWSRARPTVGLHFGDFADQEYIGMHPEVVNQLVLVLTGCLELQVGGGRIERFQAGDVVLAADKTGEGHIDRFRGRTALANIVLDDAVLWPIPTAER